jgi:hypothetical protein
MNAKRAKRVVVIIVPPALAATRLVDVGFAGTP